MAAYLISLSDYATNNHSMLKNKFLTKRREYRNQSAEWKENLDHYLRSDNSFDYSKDWQKVLIPAKLVGNKDVGGGIPYNKSDTFFADFEQHNPETYILSKTNQSYIIGNKASPDTRQYTGKWDPNNEDKTRAAGMSYMHLLIIPRKKVYNVVQLSDNEIIKEMINHFESFWKSPDAIEKVNKRIQTAIDQREAEVVGFLEKEKDTSRKTAFEAVMKDVNNYAKECGEKLKNLQVGEEGIVFRFHAGDDASIPHLHMHVLASPVEFRRFSTSAHDHKAIPARLVMEEIEAEKNLTSRVSYFIRDILQSVGLMKRLTEISCGEVG